MLHFDDAGANAVNVGRTAAAAAAADGGDDDVAHLITFY